MASSSFKSSSCQPNGIPKDQARYTQFAANLQRGDLIEIQRGVFNHWAIFDEYDTANDEYMCIDLLNDGYIRRLPLHQILKESDDCFRVNNQENEALERGLKSPDNIGDRLNELRQYVGQYVGYNMESKNCEHFCTEWRYNSPWSIQCKEVKNSFADGVILAGIGLMIGSVIFAVCRHRR